MPKLIKKQKEVFFGVKIVTSSRETRHGRHSFDLACEAIKSVCDQTYPHWRLYLIGDDYESSSQFKKLASLCPQDKITAYNLKGHKPERTYFPDYPKLAKTGGHKASCFCLDLMKAMGVRYIANLDDDDLWFHNHLELIAEEYRKTPAPAFVTTLSNWQYRGIIPFTVVEDNGTLHMRPIIENGCKLPGNISHSAASWDSKKLPFQYRNRVVETGWEHQFGDYDMWEIMEHHCNEMDYKITLVPEVTVEYR